MGRIEQSASGQEVRWTGSGRVVFSIVLPGEMDMPA